MSSHGLRKQLRALRAFGATRLVPQRDAKVVLGQSPVLRDLLPGVHLQRTPTRRHGLPEQLRALGASAATRLLAQREAKVVLGRSPVLRKLLSGVHLQRTPI